MPFTVTMPKLSPTMEAGTIVRWHKAEGEWVDAGELLLEVATDKATVEYNALDEGFLRKILIKEGSSAPINQAVAIFSVSVDESLEDYKPEGLTPAVNAPSHDKDLPKESRAPMESSSLSSSIPVASFSPFPPLEKNFPYTRQSSTKINASPLAKSLAQKRGLDLQGIKGSGPQGRVVSRDLPFALPKNAVSFAPQQEPTVAAGSFREVPLTPMRKAIGEKLQQAKSSIPHFYVRQKINIDPLLAIREQLKQFNIKLTVNDFIIRAAALSLKEHPQVNSGFNSASNSLIFFQTIDISIAVTIPDGLITPIIRYADYKNLGEISIEMKDLGQRAKQGKLQLEEYQGGSFTISNLGMFGIQDFSAILNPPQAAILAVGGIEEVARVTQHAQLEMGKNMMLTLSVDHRVIDGAEAAQFLKTLQRHLESPAVLLI